MLNLERVNLALTNLGMNVREAVTESGKPSIEAEIEIKRGCFSVFAIAEGARLQKPNGTSKYLYGCTDGKLRAVVLQTIKANS